MIYLCNSNENVNHDWIKSINQLTKKKTFFSSLRSIIQTIVFGLIALYNKRSPWGLPQERWSLVGRAVTGAINQGCWYISVRKISLTDSSAVYYSAPVYVALLAYVFLKEPFGMFEGVSIIVTVIGVITISKPSFIPIFGNDSESLSGEHLEGLLFALGGALTFACSNIFVRKLQKTSTEITTSWFSIACVVLGSIVVAYYKAFRFPTDPFEWFIITASGISGVLGNICFVTALKIEKAGPVSVAQTCNIVIVLIYQIAFFNEPLSIFTLIGAFLIASSVALTGNSINFSLSLDQLTYEQLTKQKLRLCLLNQLINFSSPLFGLFYF